MDCPSPLLCPKLKSLWLGSAWIGEILHLLSYWRGAGCQATLPNNRVAPTGEEVVKGVEGFGCTTQHTTRPNAIQRPSNPAGHAHAGAPTTNYSQSLLAGNGLGGRQYRTGLCHLFDGVGCSQQRGASFGRAKATGEGRPPTGRHCSHPERCMGSNAGTDPKRGTFSANVPSKAPTQPNCNCRERVGPGLTWCGAFGSQ